MFFTVNQINGLWVFSGVPQTSFPGDRGLLTGQTSGPVVTPQRKRQLLATIANVEGVGLREVKRRFVALREESKKKITSSLFFFNVF